MINFWDKIWQSIVNNGIDWVITGTITYFTVRSATRRYYDATKRQVAKGIMEQGLRALLKLEYNESLPEDAQVIFVKYGGRCMNFRGQNKCKFMQKIRRTIDVVGGNTIRVSEYRPIDFGVLGVANRICLPVVFDFQNGKLYKYERGRIIQEKTFDTEGCYYYQKTIGESLFLSEKNTTRDIMIAIPLKPLNKKIVGGVTFDLKVGFKTVYQKIEQTDSDKVRIQKERNNLIVFNETMLTARNLLNAYFKKKGENF